jgi:hypothetical protein
MIHWVWLKYFAFASITPWTRTIYNSSHFFTSISLYLRARYEWIVVPPPEGNFSQNRLSARSLEEIGQLGRV